MKRRRVNPLACLALAIGCLFVAPAPRAVLAQGDSAAIEVALELMEASGARNMFDQMVPAITKQMGMLVEKMNPGEGVAVNDLLQSKFVPRILERSNEVIEMIAHVYAQHFTLDELEQLVAFYNSPVGRKLVQEQPEMMTEAMQIGRNWGQSVAAEVLQELAPDFESRGLKMPNI